MTDASPSSSPRARLAARQHRVLIYLTCYNVLDGYVISASHGVRMVIAASVSSKSRITRTRRAVLPVSLTCSASLTLESLFFVYDRCHLQSLPDDTQTGARNTGSRPPCLHFDNCFRRSRTHRPGWCPPEPTSYIHGQRQTYSVYA